MAVEHGVCLRGRRGEERASASHVAGDRARPLGAGGATRAAQVARLAVERHTRRRPRRPGAVRRRSRRAGRQRRAGQALQRRPRAATLRGHGTCGPVLDGSRSACRWGRDPRAVEPGRLPPARQPHLFRRDYVTNSNDSYWLSNPHRPLEGFPRITGDERTARSLRTRIGLLMTQARVDGTDGLGPAGFTRADLEHLVFSNRQYAGELTRDALVAMWRALPGGLAPTSAGTPVAIGAACEVLAAWDLRENLDSRGAILFRRFWDNLTLVNELDSWWVRPFDPSDPINTPSGIDTAQSGVAVALGNAIADVNTAHMPLDASVGDVQRVVRGGRRIPIHGGPGDPNGQFNAIESGFTPGRGFGEVAGGSSYVQVVTWNDGPARTRPPSSPTPSPPT